MLFFYSLYGLHDDHPIFSDNCKMDGLSVPHDDDGHGSDLDTAKALHAQMQRQSGANIMHGVDGHIIQVSSICVLFCDNY